MKGHEDLTWSDNLCQTQRHGLYLTAPRDDIDTIMRLQSEPFRISRINLEPSVRRESIENRHIPCLGACVPVFHRTTGVKHEWKLRVRLIGIRLALDSEQLRPAGCRLEFSVFVETRNAGLCAFGKRPLQSAVFLDQGIRHARVVAKTTL